MQQVAVGMFQPAWCGAGGSDRLPMAGHCLGLMHAAHSCTQQQDQSAELTSCDALQPLGWLYPIEIMPLEMHAAGSSVNTASNMVLCPATPVMVVFACNWCSTVFFSEQPPSPLQARAASVSKPVHMLCSCGAAGSMLFAAHHACH